MNSEIFQYVADISDEDMKFVDMDDALKVIKAMNILQEEYKPKGIDRFEFEGDTYFLSYGQYVKQHFWRLYRIYADRDEYRAYV